MSGIVGDLSFKQEEALRKLRAAVSDIEHDLPESDDYFFLRWLRARKFKGDKAEQCIRNHLEFRQRFGVDTISKVWMPPLVLTKFVPGGFFGEDRDGHPVWHSNMGNLDIQGLCHSARKEDIMKFIFYYVETNLGLLDKCSEKHGRRIETVTSVIDLEHLSYRKHFYWPGILVFRELVTILETNYPERIKRVLIVRAPKIFPMAYSLVKHFMDDCTKEKIIVFGYNADNWQEELQKYISPDQLPQAYGGTRCEPDPYCTDYIKQGGDIPPEYYNMTEINKDEMERVVVGRRETCELEFPVSQPGTVLRWEFVTSDHGITFGWHLKEVHLTKSSNAISVVPLQKVNSHLVAEVGFHECSQVGTYVMKFDNSHSWTHSKEVLYSVKVTLPDTFTETMTSPSRRLSREVESNGSSSPLRANGDSEEHNEDARSLYFTPSPGPSLSPPASLSPRSSVSPVPVLSPAESREELDN